MKDVKSKVAITLVCMLLGITLAIQFKTVNKTIENIIPSQRAQQLAIELKNLQEERIKLLEELSNYESRIKEYEKNAAEESVYVKRLTEDIQKYKMLSGYEEVVGPGVTIVIKDPPMDVQFGDDSSYLVESYFLLLELISNLNAAGAEAISISEQRYTNYTEILPVGNHININGVSFVPPIIVKAIGNTEILESALNFRGGIVWRMQNWYSFDVQIKTEQNIEIPKYTKLKEFRYANPKNNTN